MKKKRLLSILIAVVVVFVAMGAFAASQEKTGRLDGVDVTASCSLQTASGGASTSFASTADLSKNPKTTVNATYSYYNIYTNETGSQTKSANNPAGTRGASVTFTAPTDCHSISVVASHTASYSTQNWNTTTSLYR